MSSKTGYEGLGESFTAMGQDLPLNLPVHSFDEFPPQQLPPMLCANIIAAGFTAPTMLQRSALPVGLARRDMLIVAPPQTFGQIASLVLPLLTPLLCDDSGAGRTPSALSVSSRGLNAPKSAPSALFVAPIRELVHEGVTLARALLAGASISVGVASGGIAVEVNAEELAGSDVLFATPGRLVDLAEKGALSLCGVRRLALAGADRMLDLGYEPHLCRLVLEEGMPPPKERQSLIACAVADKRVRTLLGVLARPDVVVVCNSVPWRGAVTRSLVTQHVAYAEEESKQAVLAQLVRAQPDGLTLVITKTRHSCDMAGFYLRDEGVAVVVLNAEKLKPKESRFDAHDDCVTCDECLIRAAPSLLRSATRYSCHSSRAPCPSSWRRRRRCARQRCRTYRMSSALTSPLRSTSTRATSVARAGAAAPAQSRRSSTKARTGRCCGSSSMCSSRVAPRCRAGSRGSASAAR